MLIRLNIHFELKTQFWAMYIPPQKRPIYLIKKPGAPLPVYLMCPDSGIQRKRTHTTRRHTMACDSTRIAGGFFYWKDSDAFSNMGLACLEKQANLPVQRGDIILGYLLLYEDTHEHPSLRRRPTEGLNPSELYELLDRRCHPCTFRPIPAEALVH